MVDLSLPRLRGLTVSARTFRRVATFNVFWLFVIVSTGATVRLTGSGLGCKHWPGCNAGAQVFPTSYHAYVEFTNRVISGVAVFVALAIWLLAIARPALPSWVRWITGAAFIGTLAEAPLGAITVEYKLNPWLVAAHFLLSIVILLFGILVLLEAWGVRGDAAPSWMRRGGLLVGFACAVLVVTGTLATAAGPHSGSIAVPRIWSLDSAVYWHVRATAVFGIAFAILLVWLVARQMSQLHAGFLVLGVLATQMVVGEVQYRNHLPWWLVLIHVTLAAALWSATAALVALLWRPRGSRLT